MALIKLGKRNDAGEDVGPFLLNTDQIVAVMSGPRATEIQTADGQSALGSRNAGSGTCVSQRTT